MDKRQRFLALQGDLLAKVRQRITALVGGSTPELVRYERAFRRSLPRIQGEATRAELHKGIERSKVILFSDFHSLPINQKNFLDLLGHLQKRSKQPFFIALECFCHQDQGALDLYLQGHLSAQGLYEKTNFRTLWGFPWAPIERILRFAKKHAIPVGGLNRRSSKVLTLQERDLAFARHIVAFMDRFAGHKIICLVGELHMAHGHLPKQLKKLQPRLEKEKTLLRILSNTDKYYFAVLKNPKEKLSSCLRVSANTYCLLDTPPWAKWLTYLLWQEHLWLHPDCSGCARPWMEALQRHCIYEIDEYLYECMQAFLKYFKSVKKYPRTRPFAESQVVPLIEEPAAKALSAWAYQCFLHHGAVYESEKARVYWQPLCWRGMLAVLTQSFFQAHPGMSTPEPEQNLNQDLFVRHVQLSLACHALESVFNPVGYLNKEWFAVSSCAAQNPRGALAAFGSQQGFGFPDFYLSYDLGRRLAYVWNQVYKHRANGYGYLHALLSEGKMQAFPYLAEINASREAR